jgi:uncharacterized protein
VAPDGSAFNLMSPGLDVLRASYRNGSLQPEYPEPRAMVHLNLDRLLTSNTFRAGHRIRAQISGAFFPHFSRNLQTGGSELTTSSAITCIIRILHNKEHPSRIILPIVPRNRTDRASRAKPGVPLPKFCRNFEAQQ